MSWDLNSFWLVLGLTGQIIFGSRFVLQWISSERAKKSRIPFYFWYISLFGSILLLTYAIHKKDIVIIIGQAGGFVVYIRNIMLLKKTNV